MSKVIRPIFNTENCCQNCSLKNSPDSLIDCDTFWNKMVEIKGFDGNGEKDGCNLHSAREIKKLFYKVYENKKYIDNYFVERPEKIEKMAGFETYDDFLENEEYDNIPVLEPVFMTENEFDSLPEFQGF